MPWTNTSLLWKSVNYGRNEFYNTGPRVQFEKKLFGSWLDNLLISLDRFSEVDLSVYNSEVVKLTDSQVYSKKFYEIGPGCLKKIFEKPHMLNSSY